MTFLIVVFAVIVVSASALASLAVWSSRGPWPKGAALALSTVLIVSGFAGLIELLGIPKPARLDITDASTKDAKVLATSVREGEMIYVWLQPKDADEPRAYAMPWEDNQARQLFRALDEAQANGSEVRVRGSLTSRGLYKDAPFYVAPQEPLPPKPFEQIRPTPGSLGSPASHVSPPADGPFLQVRRGV